MIVELDRFTVRLVDGIEVVHEHKFNQYLDAVECYLMTSLAVELARDKRSLEDNPNPTPKYTIK